MSHPTPPPPARFPEEEALVKIMQKQLGKCYESDSEEKCLQTLFGSDFFWS